MRAALAIAAGLAPALTQACPVCARDAGPNAAIFIGALVLAPYLVAAVVIRAIRAAGGDR